MLLTCTSINLFSQNINDDIYKSDEIRIVISGEKYKAGWFHEFIFGAHWRNLWISPVEAEVLNMNTFAGGLTLIKKGGGFQTKSLRFQGEDGYVWKFRSLDKDPASILPKDLQESIVADVLQDQISSSNPFAPFIVAPILNAVGILQSIPKLVIMPDDEKLGEYRKEFGGLLGTIEINPDEKDDNEEFNFGGAEKIMGTFKLIRRLEEHREEKVNSTEFLKARLIDVFIGDWDRHTDQWRWARYEKHGMETWYPIPRDRDQAFAKFDGLGPTLADYYIKNFNHFDFEYPSAENITWSGRHLDRRYLIELTKTQWDSVTTFVKNKLTHEVIFDAVNHLPETQFEIAGEELISKLKSRRDLLSQISNEYYEMIQNVADVWGSDKDDFAEIIRFSDNETILTLYKRDKETGEKKGNPFFKKTFDNSLTDEIRIYLQNGDDKAIVKGSVNGSPNIRLITGEGKDEVINDSKVNGNFLGILPFNITKNKTFIYDSGKKSIFKKYSGTVVDNSEYPDPKTDEEKYEPQLNDRGNEWLLYPFFQFDTDNGFTIGASKVLTEYGFRAEPFSYQMTFFVSYSTTPKSPNFYYKGIFNSIVKNSSLQFELTSTELTLTKYYGFGNETNYNDNLERADYYRLEQKLFEVKPSFLFHLFDSNTTGFELSYSYQNSSIRNITLLNDFSNGNYGLGKFNLIGSKLKFVIDRRDNINNAQKGYYLNLSGEYYPEALDNAETFYKAGFDARAFATVFLLSETTLAIRTGGGNNWGKYPFFKAEFLGGSENLRGYRRERFSGDASVFGQAEVRSYVGKWRLIVPGKFGVLSFIESGRIFVKGANSEKWHPSYGGGIWLSFIDRAANFSFTFAKTEESSSIIFKAGMNF